MPSSLVKTKPKDCSLNTLFFFIWPKKICFHAVQPRQAKRSDSHGSESASLESGSLIDFLWIFGDCEDKTVMRRDPFRQWDASEWCTKIYKLKDWNEFRDPEEIPQSDQWFAEMPAFFFLFLFVFPLTNIYWLWSSLAQTKICRCWEMSSSEEGKAFVVCSDAEIEWAECFLINTVFPSLQRLALSFCQVALKPMLQFWGAAKLGASSMRRDDGRRVLPSAPVLPVGCVLGYQLMGWKLMALNMQNVASPGCCIG